eukprot:gene11119-3938_t
MGLKVLNNIFNKRNNKSNPESPIKTKRQSSAPSSRSSSRRSSKDSCSSPISEISLNDFKMLQKHRKSLEKIANEYSAIHLEGVTKNEILSLLEYWYLLTNGGIMTPEYFGSFLRDTFPLASEDAGCSSFLFRSMDPDLSGEIDPHEFLDLILGLGKKFEHEKNTKIWFNFYDSDANGVISQQDVEDCIIFFREAVGMDEEAADEFRGIFKLYYVDDKNIVTYEKFQEMIEDRMNVTATQALSSLYEKLSQQKNYQKRKSQ